MVLDPAWYNALVDDDGSGLTGTVWNKAVIKGLTDNIDAQLAAVAYSQNYYNAGLASAGGGVPAYIERVGFYGLIGKLCIVQFSITLRIGSLAGGVASIVLPFPAVGIGQTTGAIAISWFTGLTLQASSLAAVLNPNSTLATIMYVPGAGAGAVSYFETGHMGAGDVYLKGGGAYLIA